MFETLKIEIVHRGSDYHGYLMEGLQGMDTEDTITLLQAMIEQLRREQDAGLG